MINDPNYIACPVCDVIHHIPAGQNDRRTVCQRCGHRLTAGQSGAVTRVVASALSSALLMIVVLFTPFLDLHAGQFGSAATVFQAVMGFSEGIMVPLSLAALAFVVLLPLTRLLLLVYALGPASLRRAPLPYARAALRMALALKPWAMAEIFMVGVAVALVKLADMATVNMGPAFWAFGALVLITAYQDSVLCRNTVWTALTARR